MADDNKPNVIPFAWRGVITSADLGETAADLTKAGARELIDSVEAQGFEGEAGPLENCAEWIELRQRFKTAVKTG